VTSGIESWPDRNPCKKTQQWKEEERKEHSLWVILAFKVKSNGKKRQWRSRGGQKGEQIDKETMISKAGWGIGEKGGLRAIATQKIGKWSEGFDGETKDLVFNHHEKPLRNSTEGGWV